MSYIGNRSSLPTIIKKLAEERVREKFKEFLLKELDPVVEELLDAFVREFKVEIQAAVYRDANTFVDNLLVDVRRSK